MEKSKILSILICLAFIFGGCDFNYKNEMLSLENLSLSTSMENFFKDESISYTIGKNFQFKILSIAKVDFNKAGFDTSYSFYRYQLLIAPLYDMPIDINNITFGVNENLVDYYKEVPIGRTGLEDQQLDINEIDIPPKNRIEDLIAYRMDFTISNLGDDIQKSANLSSSEFDELMRSLVITVEYNNKIETTAICYKGEILDYSQDKDYIEKNRPDLVELLENGTTSSFFAPYQGEFVKLNR